MATAALIAGTTLMAGGQIREGQLAAARGEASNDIAELNALTLRRQAKSNDENYLLNDTRLVRRSKMVMGEQITEQGASGVVSDVDALADTAFQLALDRNLALRQGLIESTGLLNQAAMTRAQGKFAKKVGKHQRTMSYAKAGGTILGGMYTGYDRGLLGGSSGDIGGWARSIA